VDFIISTISGKSLPIEVKISSNVHKTELKNIKSFMEEHQVDQGYVVCLEDIVKYIELGVKEHRNSFE
jgi:predicted AAA+ superfamily ATPase